MQLNEIILLGLKVGVERHWKYTKEYLNIKPEYLLTVSVADELINNGFDSISGLDIQLDLEKPTKEIAFEIFIQFAGFDKWFSGLRPKIKRKGKVDIFLNAHKKFYAIELKGFDPSATQINKEFERLSQFFEINNYRNNLHSSFVAFPTKTDKTKWINKLVKEKFDSNIYSVNITNNKEITGSNPEDGIPVYYTNCIDIQRR